MAPLQAPAPSSGPPAPPATQLQARGGSHAPSSGSTLCCKHPVYSHLFIMKPTIQEQPGGQVHRARHSARRRNPHSPPAPPSQRRAAHLGTPPRGRLMEASPPHCDGLSHWSPAPLPCLEVAGAGGLKAPALSRASSFC